MTRYFKITYEDKKKPYKAIQDICDTLEIDKNRPIRVDFIDSGGAWHSRFGGVNLSIRDEDFNAIRRGVKLDKEDQIDLDKVMAKYNELLQLKKEADERRKEKETIEVTRLMKENALKQEFPAHKVAVSKSALGYTVKLFDLTEEQVHKIAQVLKD